MNAAVATGPVALADVIDGLAEPYLAHVIVLWSWASKQQAAGEKVPMTTVRFRSLIGDDHAIEVPDLTFTEPIPTAEVDAE